jgi:predicted dehydrogenase
MCIYAGIIGFGYMGHYHLGKSKGIDGLEIISAYDTDPQKLADAKSMGLTIFDTLEQMLADERISLVFICTPNHKHAELSIRALNAGKHVMCEKPVTMNADELETVIAAANRNRKVFTVHQNRRWDADFLAISKVVASKDIGHITSIQSRVFGQRGVCFGWRADPLWGGGMLYDWGVHLIDQALCLFAENRITSVYARLQSILTPAVDDCFDLQLMFDNDVCVKVQVGTFCLQDLPRWFVCGDRGTLMVQAINTTAGGMARIREDVQGFDSVFGLHNLGPSRTMAPLRADYLETLIVPDVVADANEYHRNLVASVQGSETPYVSHRDMRRVMRVVDTAFESTKRNEVVKGEI